MINRKTLWPHLKKGKWDSSTVWHDLTCCQRLSFREQCKEKKKWGRQWKKMGRQYHLVKRDKLCRNSDHIPWLPRIKSVGDAFSSSEPPMVMLDYKTNDMTNFSVRRFKMCSLNNIGTPLKFILCVRFFIRKQKSIKWSTFIYYLYYICYICSHGKCIVVSAWSYIHLAFAVLLHYHY